MPDRQPLYMLSGRSYHRALQRICKAADGGRVWHNRIPRLRPSTGFYAVAFALSCSVIHPLQPLTPLATSHNF